MTERDERVILDAVTVQQLSAFLRRIEQQVAWVRGLLLSEADKELARESLRQRPELLATITRLNAEPRE